jgi:hypothetical protein
MSEYRVEEYTPEEAARIIAGLEKYPPHAKWKGWVDAWCRETDGSVAWEIHQPNIITDLGRRSFSGGYAFVGPGPSPFFVYIATSPSSETPVIGRHTLPDVGNASQYSATNVTPAYDGATLTKVFTYTFAAPASTMTIGTIAISGVKETYYFGLAHLMAYTTLSPVKTQTSSQTLEVQYRITLTPVY